MSAFESRFYTEVGADGLNIVKERLPETQMSELPRFKCEDKLFAEGVKTGFELAHELWLGRLMWTINRDERLKAIYDASQLSK